LIFVDAVKQIDAQRRGIAEGVVFEKRPTSP